MKRITISKTTHEILPDLIATVDMTTKDAEMFIGFKEHYISYLALVEADLFNLFKGRGGRALLHMDTRSNIKNVDIVHLRTL